MVWERIGRMTHRQDPASPKTVYVLATLDTKGAEGAFVREQLLQLGIDARLVDTGCKASHVAADVSRQELLDALPDREPAPQQTDDRGAAVSVSANAAAAWIRQRYDAGQLGGVLAIGGSAGTTIGTAAMRALPLGVPKLMVSTLASGQVRHYVGDKDIFMLNSVVDLSGLNRVTRRVLAEAACAMAGMITFGNQAGANEGSSDERDRPVVAATMFGVTTPCVEEARLVLEADGYEVLVFHATGNGGQAMESLIEDGLVAGVLDITTTELADELVGGVLSAGPRRLTAAARCGVPQVVSLGATDMVNFHARDSVPTRFADRKFYQHNANVTLMRTTAAECAAIGTDIGRKLSAASGPALVLAPMRGVSAIDRTGQPFDDPVARRALVDALRHAGRAVNVEEVDAHINDPEFARLAARRLLEMMGKRSAQTR
jgi:uncharacterized protein (UPF0261 family)